MEPFIHLHTHTYYSILDGQSSVQRLVDKAVANGMKGMAMTDHGNMFGIKEFYNYCKKVNKKLAEQGKEPFKPIIGCEMYVAKNKLTDKVKEHGDMGGRHLIVLAKNLKGYKNLIKLVSDSWVRGYYMRPRTDREQLEKHAEGLIVCSACLGGEVPSKILKGDIEGAKEAVLWHKKVFGQDYYLELQRHRVTDPNIVANRNTYPLQQKVNEVLIQFSKELDVPLVCTNDAHFVDEDNAEAHDHLLCLSTGRDLDDPGRMVYSKQEWFKTQEEMNEIFGDIPEALKNTISILDKVENYTIDHGPIMPFFPIPESFGTEEEYKKKYTEQQLLEEFTTDENGNNPLDSEKAKEKIQRLGGYEKIYRIKLEADYLAKLAYDGARKIYGDPLNPEQEERIKFELHIMKTMGFPGYFLIVQDFINVARNELGVLVGPGRGSAAGSVVAYCLGITRIDPMKYDLLFERFLNPDRISLPDIDTDFDDDGRGRVLDWVKEKYGHEKVAQIITYGTMATKNSIKDVARVEKVPLDVVNNLCKLIPAKLPDDLKMSVTNAIKAIPQLHCAQQSQDKSLSNTMKYAQMLEGTVRNTGIHACGTIICRDPISDWVPISTAEDKTKPGEKLLCTQYDGHVIEETGLIKMDFLGLKTLSILKEAVDNIKESKGITIDIDNVPIDDPKTYELYCKGQTIGTFQFESPGMQKYLRELHPTVFEDLIAMNALYRPGPMDYIPEFIARKKDPSRIKYDIPCMEKYLKDTYGITVYQEQVMLLSRQLAGFTRGQSDTLRKAMGKKLIEQMNQLEQIFYEGGTQNGHPKEILQKIWEDWKKFASYAFNKSHATCYSWLAFQTAYLKAHYPAEYMAAVMSRNLNDITEVTKFMDECKAMGIKIFGPDINESGQKFSVNDKGEIRFGLAAIKGVGEAAVNAIIKARKENGNYTDIFDFVKRVNLNAVNKKAIENIAISGAFDSLHIKREIFIANENNSTNFLDLLVRHGQLYQVEQAQSQNSLFGETNAIEIIHPPIPDIPECSLIEKLNLEKELVGVYLSAHPLDQYELIIKHLCNTTCEGLKDKEALAQKPLITIAGYVTKVTSKYSKKNTPYGVVTIEDFDSTGEIMLFAEEWAKWNGALKEGHAVYIKGTYKSKFKNSNFYSWNIQDIILLQTAKEQLIEKITIKLMAEDIDAQLVTTLDEIIRKQEKGKTQVYFQIESAKTRENILLRSKIQNISVDKSLIRYIEEHATADYAIN